MKRYFLSITFVLSIFLLSPILINTKLQAAEIKVDEDNPVIDEYVNDDLYITGATIQINEDVNGDVFAAGGQITITDDIYGDIYISAGTVSIEGDIRGNLICGAGQLTLDGSVDGDVIVGAGMVTINGDVGDDIRVGGGTVNVKSESVGGDILIRAGSGSVSSDTEVDGEQDVEFGETAQLTLPETTSIFSLNRTGFTSYVLNFIRKVLVLAGWLIVGWLLFKYAPVKSRLVTDILADKSRSLKSLLAGVLFMLSLIILVPLMILFTIIGIGQPLTQLFASLFSLVVTIGGIYSATGITRMLIKMKKPKYKGYILPMFIGVIVYQVLGWIPWIFCCMGQLVKIIMTTWGVGGILLYKSELISKKKKKK
ncbi:hypothetical protein ACFLY9_01585 [Patescibacteria group bacterium]